MADSTPSEGYAPLPQETEQPAPSAPPAGGGAGPSESSGTGGSGPGGGGGTGVGGVAFRDNAASKLNEVEFSDVFSTRAPQNALSGISSGLKSAAKGITGCGVALVAGPIGGYREGGASGAAAGFLAGALGGVAIATVGVGVGAAQVVRGIVNTPKAVIEGVSGKKRWDEASRQWVQDDLEQERVRMRDFVTDEDIMEAARQRAKGDSEAEQRPARQVKNMELYDVLGVPANASESEVKRAYYKKATKCHPDKNPDDPEAKANFQKLAAAYQTLSDPKKREQYDSSGETIEEDQMLHPDAIYTSLFGSEAFEPYIGKLSLSRLLSGDVQLTRHEMRELQRRREVRIALNLVKLLRPYVDDHGEAFKSMSREVAADLSKASFGDRLLVVIGRQYELSARKKLGVFDKGVASAESTLDYIKLYSKMLGSGVSLSQALHKGEAGAVAGQSPNQQGQQVATHLVDIAFEATSLDVGTTLTTAVDMVLHDSVSQDIIQRRAKGLLELGIIFMEEGRKRASPADDNEEKLRDAVLRVQTKSSDEGA